MAKKKNSKKSVKSTPIIENALPQNTWYIEFEFLGENERKITIYHKDEEM